MIDTETYGRFIASGVKSRQHGTSLIEMLDRDRLLLTSERLRLIRVDLISGVAQDFENLGAARLMQWAHGIASGTPAEAFDASLRWLRTCEEQVRKGTYPS